MAKFKIHPYCELFPEISGDEREQLKADIAAHGLRDPIIVWGNQVVDGKNRQEICDELGLKPETREWRPSAKARDGKQQDAELLAFVVSKNVHRRHLTPSQRAIVAARLETESHGDNGRFSRENAQDASLHLGREAAAEVFKVSPRSVADAAVVIESAAAPVVKAVEAGEVTVSDAAKIADLPKDEQRAALKKVESGEAKTLAAAAKRKTVAKAAKADRPFHDKSIDDLIGKLIRAFDDRARSLKTLNKGGHVECLDAMKAVNTAWKAWRKEKRG